MREIIIDSPFTGEINDYCILRLPKYGGAMYALIVTAYVLENETETFLQKTMEFAIATRSESGNLRYDILKNEDNPTCFVIYEVYRSKDDFMFHRQTPYSQKWKSETESIMAKPRERIRCHNLYFSN
jgi:autoinducer 2-degrading protein